MPLPTERRIAVVLMVLMGVCLLGCCRDGDLDSVVVQGTVSCGGQPAARGTIRFVPIGDTPGPTSTSHIVDGKYRIDSRGGVPLGKHRVEIVAKQLTGRQVKMNNGFEEVLTDETVVVSPAEYAGEQSPLEVRIASSDDDQFDFDIPTTPVAAR